MIHTTQTVKRTYYTLTLLSTLAASFIWGINTLFLLDAGLSNTAAFAANAFFTVGQVLFEVPTGIVADIRGRRASYALGSFTLLVTTILYYYLWQIHGPLWAWAVVSALLGLGFTFFSGATEAWLVDALDSTGFKDSLDSVFARGQAIAGAAMLIGSVSGGIIAQSTNLGVPYLIRAGILGITLIICLVMMRDLGFSPQKNKSVGQRIKLVFSTAVKHSWQNKPIRWMMLAAPFSGIGIYIFYAMQPYLLQLYGNPEAYGVAGLVAAIVAGAQIAGGLSIMYIKKFFKTRTSILLGATIVSVIVIALLGLVPNFWAALALMVIWGLLFAIVTPIRQAYLNGLISSEERATTLSLDSLLSNAGSAASQPLLGRAADLYGYGPSYLISAAIQIGSLPFIYLARKQKAKSD